MDKRPIRFQCGALPLPVEEGIPAQPPIRSTSVVMQEDREDTAQQEARQDAIEGQQKPHQFSYAAVTERRRKEAVTNAGKYRPVEDLPLPFEIQNDPALKNFEKACRQGFLSQVQYFVHDRHDVPTFLHQGLLSATHYGQAHVMRYLLENGAPITRQVQDRAADFAVFGAKVDQSQRAYMAVVAIAVFQALVDHGWDVNSPGYYGAPVLPTIVGNEPVLRWFLSHGADPNLGPQRTNEERYGYCWTESGAALNNAAAYCTPQTIDLLLNAGAKKEFSIALHSAALHVPHAAWERGDRGRPTPEEDCERIPMMEHLLAQGFDVNGLDDIEGPFRFGKPLDYAVCARAEQRIAFLLDHSAESKYKDAPDKGLKPRFIPS